MVGRAECDLARHELGAIHDAARLLQGSIIILMICEVVLLFHERVSFFEIWGFGLGKDDESVTAAFVFRPSVMVERASGFVQLFLPTLLHNSS